MRSYLSNVIATESLREREPEHKDVARFLIDTCGPKAGGASRMRYFRQRLSAGQLPLDTRISASYCIFEDIPYCTFSDKALETLIAYGHSGSEVLHDILSHHHSPHSDRVRRFWLPDDGKVQLAPGDFGARHDSAMPRASDMAFGVIIHHPKTNLTATNEHGFTVMDLWARQFARQQAQCPTIELKQGLASYHRLCALMAAGAPLLQNQDDRLLASVLLPMAQSHLDDLRRDADDVRHLLPQDVDAVIFRHWSLTGMLEEVLALPVWHGHEKHLLGLMASLPENEALFCHPRIVSAVAKADAQVRKAWATDSPSPRDPSTRKR